MRLNWIAIEGGEPSELIRELGLHEVGAANEPFDGGCAYTRTAAGWLVLADVRQDLDFTKILPAVSARATVLNAVVSTIVMVSELQEWRGGAKLWSVSHDPEKGIENLDVEGERPAELVEIAARLAAEQAADADDDVDYLFDAPQELGEKLCGHNPGQPQAGPWILLAPAKGSPGPERSGLPAAIQTELLPALGDLGWTIAPIRLANGYTYDASRVREGRLEALRFLWRDDRRRLEVFPGFACLEGPGPDSRAFIQASIQSPPPTLFQRLGAWRPGQRPKPYEQAVREAIAEAKAGLADYVAAIADHEPPERSGATAQKG